MPRFFGGRGACAGQAACFAAISRFFVLLREQPPSFFGLLGCELFPRAWAISPFLPATPSFGPFPYFWTPVLINENY